MTGNIPVHISFIMDGNGRWAKARGKERVFGHFEGVESVRACTEAAVETGVKYISFFAFSEENWGRPEEEVSTLMKLMFKSMVDELGTFMTNGVRFLVRGNRSRLGDSLNAAIDDIEAKTAANTTLTMVIFLSYSGKWDIAEAARSIAQDCARGLLCWEDVDEDTVASRLCTRDIPDPDIIVRTSGEKRISNYLLWQSAYSEWFFPEKLWPDFRKEDFLEVLREYSTRERRFGKVPAAVSPSGE